MVLLDTDVVSELMRPAPDPEIESWVAERATSSLFPTSVTGAELCVALAITTRNVRDFDDIGVGIFDPWGGT